MFGLLAAYLTYTQKATRAWNFISYIYWIIQETTKSL